jgi:hypothetical protein
MADAGIKKVTILKSDLPAFNSIYGDYVVRYRIVSEDKNRTSHWSPQYKLEAPAVDTIEYSYAKDTVNKMITFVWTPEDSSLGKFDVFVKWGTGSWSYVSTVSTTTFATVIPDGSTAIQVAVQVPTFPKARVSSATLFESSQISL